MKNGIVHFGNKILMEGRKMSKSKLLGLTTLSFLVLISLGCTKKPNGENTLLPSSKSSTASWDKYENALANYNKVKLKDSEGDLKELRIYDGALNVKVLNWFGIYDTLPEGSIESGDLDQGILDFIEAKNGRVKAFEIDVFYKKSYREGSFWLDFFGFRKRTIITGYKFKGLILLVDGSVIYVFPPTGGPFREMRQKKNPLGPLQGFGDFAPKVVGHAI